MSLHCTLPCELRSGDFLEPGKPADQWECSLGFSKNSEVFLVGKTTLSIKSCAHYLLGLTATLRDLVGCRRWPHLRPGLGEPVTLRLVHPKSHLFSTIRGYHPREPSKSHPLPDLCFLPRLPYGKPSVSKIETYLSR